MVQVMIRLQNHGKKNHPYWWLIVQPKNKCFKGRAIERVGIWTPRKTKTVDRQISINKYKLKYWLSVGATPTPGAQRILSMAGLYVKRPVPYGSKFLYEKKGKKYPLDYFHKHRWGLNNYEKADLFHYEKIKRMESIIKQKVTAETEALSEIIRPRDLTSKYNENQILSYNTDMNTDDINSDDFDFYSRKRNFDLISKKLNKYFDTQFQLYRGNDLKYNNYLRKLEKLSKQENLDYEGFKDYLEGMKELNNSKNSALRNLGSHFLSELLDKESLQSEIREIVKSVDLTSLDNESAINDELKNNNQDIKIESLKKLAEKDLKSVLDVVSKGFDKVARQIFKVSPEENFSDKAFQDLKNLRMAKLLTKLRCGILSSEMTLKRLINEAENQEENSKSIYKSSDSTDFFNSIHDNLKNPSNDDTSPFFDKEILKLILNKHENVTSYDDLLFKNINNYLLSTDTFDKYKSLLFDPEFYGNDNLSSEEKSKILQNPNVYLINNEIIDELISSLLKKINLKYEMNEIYRDEEKDLNKFEREEGELTKKRKEMEKRLQELKAKHGNFDFMYDDYLSESKELREDLAQFKKDYQEEVEAELDAKFKRTLKIITPPLKLRKYYTPEEIEETKAKEEKLDRIRKRVFEEVKLKKLGIEKDAKEKKDQEELTQDEKQYEDAIRYEFESKILGNQNEFEKNAIPLPDDERPFIDLTKYLEMVKRKYKKQGKLPNQEEILRLNKIKLRMNEIYIHSLQASRGIPKERQEEMKKRFLHYFGNYKVMMYPDGFRHYENFETYFSVYPDRTMIDYQTELHQMCSFDTFVAIVYGTVNHYKKISLMALEFPELYDRTKLLAIYLQSKSSKFIVRLRTYYMNYLKKFEERNIKFKLIDALEQSATINFTQYVIPELQEMLEDDVTVKINEVITQNAFLKRKFPHIHQKGEDINLTRVGPFMPINPLKAHKANPVFNSPRVVKESKKHFPKGRIQLHRKFCTVEKFRGNIEQEQFIIKH